jgi:hypothetical protein
MNSSKKFLLLGISLLIFIFGISSVFSNEKIDSNSIRYLEDGDIDQRLLEEEEQAESSTFNCTDDNCTIANTNCSETKDAEGIYHNCWCLEDYADSKTKKCEYKQKKQLTAFLLELFVGFGAGHFYRHDYLMASLKLVAFVFGIYVICLFPLTAKCVTDCCDSDCLVVMVSIIFYLYALGLAFWYIFDLVWFGKNKYEDKTHADPINFKPW